jgi:bifunctional DNA-binding transcriptional regulator/antitoxin component of YhaV-PrlF toxin-antitoxin module
MKLQKLQNGQYVLTIPKRIVELKNWQQGDEIKLLDHDKDSLVLRKV